MCRPPPAGRWLVLVLLVLLVQGTRTAMVVDGRRPVDEYVVEHEVPRDVAFARARNLKIYPGGQPGCKSCSAEEMEYCRDGSVLEDHCCCDGAYNEVLGFVNHVCRVGPEACQVRASDCAEYSRLRECCCHSYLASLWKYLAGGARSLTTPYPLLGLLLLLLLLLAAVGPMR